MPSPFPGMDPYLEHRSIFPGLHDGMITYLRESLQPQLPAPYYADMGRRAWVEVSERYSGPDVNVLRPAVRKKDKSTQSGGVATAVRPASEPLVIHVPHDERREPFLEIYTGRGEDRRLVTTIEILSPANKTPGHRGRDLYLQKQVEILESQVHLVEIDLQAVFTRSCDTGPYRREIDYRQDQPAPPLEPHLADWVNGLLART